MFRDDISIDWTVDPRVITVAAPSVELTMQDLVDTLRELEDDMINLSYDTIITASGKETLSSDGTKVGITAGLIRAKIGFEGRPGPEWTLCSFIGGNLVAYTDKTLDTQMEPINPTSFVSIKATSSSSATLQEQEALQYASYGGVVSVDVIDGISGTTYPAGNMEYPSNNVQDAVQIASDKGFTTISIRGDLTLTDGDDVRGLALVGVSHVNSVLVVEPAALCLETQFRSFNMSGTLDGNSEIVNCVVGDLEYFNGHIHDSFLNGTITLTGDANAVIDDCAILSLLDTPVINCNDSAQNLVMTNWSGPLLLINSGVGNDIGLGCDAADIYIHESCTDGIIAISGTGSVLDNSGPICYVINKIIDGSEMQNLKVLLEQLRPHHTGTGNMIFYDPINGSDVHHGDHVDRGFKTWAKVHDTIIDGNHDIVIIVADDPSGETVVTEDITITKDYVFVRGPGRDVIMAGEISTTARGTEFSGFRVQNTLGVHSTGAFTLLENLWFEGCNNGALMEAHHPLVHSCKFSEPAGYGIRMVGDISHGEIYDCVISNAGGNALEVDTTSGTGGIKMRDTVVISADGYGVDLSTTTTKFISESGNVVKYNTLGNFNDLGSENVTTSGVEVDAQAIWGYSDRTLTEGTGLDEEQLHDALDTYTNKDDWMADVSNLSADVNIVEVAGVPVASINDFHVPVADVVSAVWAAAIRTLTVQTGMTIEESTHLLELSTADAITATIDESKKTRNTVLAN